MRTYIIALLTLFLLLACKNEKTARVNTTPEEGVPAGSIQVAKDVVTEIIVKPDSLGDPWEVEKVAGYKGREMIDDIFRSIYEGKLTARDYHTGQPLTVKDVKEFEKEFTDRSMIGKLSFTEDWYYNPSTFAMSKKVKSMAFGYELLNNEGRVFGYKAIFSIEPAK